MIWVKRVGVVVTIAFGIFVALLWAILLLGIGETIANAG